ncbi:Mu transposase C-terminal domain-containing protein [Geoalkalibacter subterraneus]|uniref:Integrase catalytic domain-containing protein n=1 Tax=Geoalkalibacter subterraneus TaxID=483547 RepID=A0A0B5FHW8_9BACT|nr:Mu transposase C-terminal domain-containing protein [Geoalkalibacter subterraneus]AJF07792.1 hypothetical protein GSUB_16230 [Geoalkalibacter subterraneus]
MNVKTSDIAAALGVGDRAIRKRAANEGWTPLPKRAKGGGKVYDLAALPISREERELIRGYLADQQLGKLTEETRQIPEALPCDDPQTALATKEDAGLPAVIDVQDLGSLKTWQQRRMDARLVFIRLIERAEMEAGVSKGIDYLVRESKAGTLPEELQELVPVANARSGKGGARALSRRTLMRWWSDYKKSGGNYAALAPKTVEKDQLPPWAAAFLKQYQVPQKISVADAIERMKMVALPGEPIPSEGQARRFLKKFSRLDVQRGRKTASELRGQRMYRQRDVSEFLPLDIVQIDGHSFKAYVAHPSHGRPFHPEVCAVIDTVTKVVIGWSAGLAESATTVADAIRHGVTVDENKPVGGLPLFVYADKGAGNMAKVNIDKVAGLFPRVGINFESGRPGNPQGRGLVENLNKGLWIRAAKKLPTYTGKDMDTAVKRKVYLALDKEVKQAQKEQRDVQSDLMIPWAEFLLLMESAVEDYNRRPHSALPRITDPQTGRRRNMCPLEAWASWLERGWRPETLTDDEIALLFRPHQRVTTRKGIVRLWKNVYADAALEHYHGEQVMVGYDIHDASRVWVRDQEGRLIVIAKRDANKSAFFPVSKVEQAREERYKNRMRNVERRAEEIELERRGGPIEARKAPEVVEIAPEALEKSERIIAKVEKKGQADFMPSNDYEAYERLEAERKRGEALTEKEQQWLADYNAFLAGKGKKGLLRSGWQPFAERARKARGERGDE